MKTHDNIIGLTIGTSVALLWCILTIVCALDGCSSTTSALTIYNVDHDTRIRFEECIEYHPSDAICDSCWQAIVVPIYGNHD